MMKQFRTYRFTNKDPVCDEVATLVDDAGLRGRQHTGKIATLSTLAKSTVDGLLYGDTCHPRNSTVMAIATSLGFERTWKRTTNRFDLEAELKKAREFIRAQAKMREKAKRPKKKPRKAKKSHLRLVSKAA